MAIASIFRRRQRTPGDSDLFLLIILIIFLGSTVPSLKNCRNDDGSNPVGPASLWKFHVWRRLTISDVLKRVTLQNLGEERVSEIFPLKRLWYKLASTSQKTLFSWRNYGAETCTTKSTLWTDLPEVKVKKMNFENTGVHIIAILLLFASPPRFLTSDSYLFFSMGIW
jgi:hypothetical protein